MNSNLYTKTFFSIIFAHLVEWASSMESALNSVSIATKLQFWMQFCTLGRISSKLCLVTSLMTLILVFLKFFLRCSGFLKFYFYSIAFARCRWAVSLALDKCSPTARECQTRCVDLAFAHCRWAFGKNPK